MLESVTANAIFMTRFTEVDHVTFKTWKNHRPIMVFFIDVLLVRLRSWFCYWREI